MVAGLIHLVAPTARIMPLKAFAADGTATLFDIERAIYYAIDHGAKVINMSFSMDTASDEFTQAIDEASGHGLISFASAGNSGRSARVYPAALCNVMGIDRPLSATSAARSRISGPPREFPTRRAKASSRCIRGITTRAPRALRSARRWPRAEERCCRSSCRRSITDSPAVISMTGP
jgi:subtilisin family serine protease